MCELAVCRVRSRQSLRCAAACGHSQQPFTSRKDYRVILAPIATLRETAAAYCDRRTAGNWSLADGGSAIGYPQPVGRENGELCVIASRKRFSFELIGLPHSDK